MPSLLRHRGIVRSLADPPNCIKSSVRLYGARCVSTMSDVSGSQTATSSNSSSSTLGTHRTATVIGLAIVCSIIVIGLLGWLAFGSNFGRNGRVSCWCKRGSAAAPSSPRCADNRHAQMRRAGDGLVLDVKCEDSRSDDESSLTTKVDRMPCIPEEALSPRLAEKSNV